MTTNTMEKLINSSIKVIPGTITVFPDGEEEEIDISVICKEFNRHYSINNTAIAFVDNGNFYVTPYSRQVITNLVENCFIEGHFLVPFSNGDYPKEEQDKWDELKEETEMKRRRARWETC